jgi:hypothetical protein
MIGISQTRIREVAETFRAKGATSPEKAVPLEELGLPPMFERMMRSPLGQSGPFLESEGKYYLSEERFKRWRERLGSG